MILQEKILEDLKNEGKYSNGDVKLELTQDGVDMIFNKKENIRETLLTGIDKKEILNANPAEIQVTDFISKNTKITKDTKQQLILSSSGGIEDCVDELLNFCYRMQETYDKTASHITRMFGSYILIVRRNDELKAIYSTPSPMKYCPLMFKLLREIGGDIADNLLASLKNGKQDEYQKHMLDLINNVVIKGGGFNDNRPLNSCEKNVTFGASEIMSDAMQTGKIDAAVIVSNNLGTVITTTPVTTQGVVKRMTGLFYTTPSPDLVKEAFKNDIIPVFPFTGKIDQVEGVKQAIKLGFKNISVSVAANDNYKLKELSSLETEGINIYRFGLCATGINNETAEIMAQNADIVWSCASKPVRELIAPKAISQVGVKIPVYILSKRGWELVKPRIGEIDGKFDLDGVILADGENMPVIYNKQGELVSMKFSELDERCVDCPEPCV